MTKRRPIKAAAAKPKQIIAMSAPVSFIAAEEADGKKASPRFTSTFYTGGALRVEGWDLPIVIDLAGLEPSNVLVANLDHDRTKRVGNFAVANDGKTLVANGTATARTLARDEVVGSAEDGYQWQSSIEASPREYDTVKAGKTVTANGQEFTGPLYLVSKSTLKGFAFVSHGADDNTTVSIAAGAASTRGVPDMDPKLKAWIEAMGFDPDTLTADQLAGLTANYNGQKPKKPPGKLNLNDGIEQRKIEAERVDAITEIALTACERRPYDIDAIKALAEQSIEGKWTVEKFRLELLEASLPQAHSVFAPRPDRERLNNRIMEAAICQAGRLNGYEKMFDEQTLQAAHDRFKGRIGLSQLLLLGAEANGYRSSFGQVTIEAQRAAFGMVAPNQIHAGAFSTLSISNVIAATANKFLREGWDAIDMTPLRIAAIRSVRNFQQITTVSLTGALQFEQLGAAGEIKHGTLADLTYTNQADTYAAMLAITRKDIINDDLGALTAVPRRLGRGGALMLNHIFWTEFLNNSAFFLTANANSNETFADATLAGLATTEAMFLKQTDPDGKPLGIRPQIVLVPVEIHATMAALLDPQSTIVSGATTGQSSINVFRGRFRLETSPYMSNTAYTGYSAIAWYMLANPSDLPVIEIAALNGNVMPVVETADADFNTLGVQMRGYSDVGVNLQEYRGGVRADGNAS